MATLTLTATLLVALGAAARAMNASQPKFVVLSTQRSGTHYFMSTLRARTRAYAYDEIFYEHPTSRKKSDGMIAGLDVFFGARPYEPRLHDAIAYGRAPPLRDLLRSGAIDRFAARGCTVHYGQGPLVSTAHWRRFVKFLATRRVALVHLVRRDARRGAISHWLLEHKTAACVAESARRAVERSARSRAATVRRARKSVEGVGDGVLEVFYEDLLRDDGTRWGAVFDFLGVAAVDAAADAATAKLHPEAAAADDFFERRAPNGSTYCPWAQGHS